VTDPGQTVTAPGPTVTAAGPTTAVTAAGRPAVQPVAQLPNTGVDSGRPLIYAGLSIILGTGLCAVGSATYGPIRRRTH
jgi:LPXTG-motif cell wall-anchored protein